MDGGGESWSWLSGWSAPAEGVVSNYYEDQKLMDGPLIKLGDYAHYRYFLLYRNGRFCYYELPMPKPAEAGEQGGNRRVHLTLTAKHLRGVMMLNASLIGKELPKREDEYDSEAIHRGMAFNRKRLEMNLTGYSPTGQLTSWKLRAANDATYCKWEKAFRLALRPIWVQNTPHCAICLKEFSLLFRPHHCRKCGTCMCDECSVYVPRLPMQGYYDAVRICRDCSPVKIQQTDLKVGVRVLVYGMYAGRIVQMNATDDSEHGGAFVSVEMEKEDGIGAAPTAVIGGSNADSDSDSDDGVDKNEVAENAPVKRVRRVGLEYVEWFSEAVLSANRIKNSIRRHLAQRLFRAQLHFNTWNQLEAVQEQRTVQMVRILSRSASMTELRSMVPTLGSYDTPRFPMDSQDEHEKVLASLEHYHGVTIVFPLRLETVMKLIDQFRNGILFHRLYLHQMLEEAKKVLLEHHPSPMNDVTIPPGVNLIVVGDLHGQLEDLLTIFDKNGVPSQKTWYLFNGDFVDRGSHGVEVMTLLLAFKIMYPSHVFLNRGNHEERMINENFGFEDELYIKYGSDSLHYDGGDAISCSAEYSSAKLFEMFEDVFMLLPIFALVNERVFVTHGGLSSHENVTLEELRKINHQREVPTQGTSREDVLFTHLLWSDPRTKDGCKPSERGAGVEFGPDITRNFCHLNKLRMVIRSHECHEQGYEITHDGMLLSIFSASSYCGSQTNRGAVVQLQVVENGDLKPNVVQHNSQPLQKLRSAGKNEWRKKALRLERRTMMSLVEMICEKKAALTTAYSQMDTIGTGCVTKLQWKQGLHAVLSLDIPFLSYFHGLVGDDAILDGSIDYEVFLTRYTVELSNGNIDWRRHLLRRVWFAFCSALSEQDGTDAVDKMSMQEKLRAAFNLFQNGDPSNPMTTKSQAPKADGNTRSVASQKFHANYFVNGFVTYDVFRDTIRGKLGLGDTLSEQQILELMEYMDDNRDGLVDFDEFCLFFAEFSRSEYLQELFDVDDVRAIDLLQQFGAHLHPCTHFPSLKIAFETMDVGGKGWLDVSDIQEASKLLGMIPSLDETGAKSLYSAIIGTHYGSTSSSSCSLDWGVFEDVFSPDSARQRSLWMSSRSASSTSLHDMADDAISDPRPGLFHNRAGREKNGALGMFSRKKQSWVDALLENVKSSLHEQRLYLKFVFRMLDKKHRGAIRRTKFIAAMKCINEEYRSPIKEAQLEQLADAFKIDGAGEPMIAYPAFLNSLRVVDADTLEVTSVEDNDDKGCDGGGIKPTRDGTVRRWLGGLSR